MKWRLEAGGNQAKFLHLNNMEMVGRPGHEIPPAQKIRMMIIRIRITIRPRLIIMTIKMMVLTKVIMMIILI